MLVRCLDLFMIANEFQKCYLTPYIVIDFTKKEPWFTDLTVSSLNDGLFSISLSISVQWIHR